MQVGDIVTMRPLLQAADVEAFVRSLSSELAVRLEAAGFRGHRLTLKLMMRKAGAPTESAKFLGHGICDHLSRFIILLPVFLSSLSLLLLSLFEIFFY